MLRKRNVVGVAIWQGFARLVQGRRYDAWRDSLVEKQGGRRDIADLFWTCHPDSMKRSAERLATDWMDYAKLGPNEAPEAVFSDGWELVETVVEDPDIVWQAIKVVVARYPINEYFAFTKTEAQAVVGLLAAGPLEDLLSYHGPQFIELVEVEARCDRRMAWAVGGVWQGGVTNEIWARVQNVADYSFWERPLAE